MATKKSAKKSSKKSTMVDPPPKPYSCKTPPREPMGLEQTADLLQSDPDFAVFFAVQLCMANSGGPTSPAAACVEAFYHPTDDELAAMCFKPADFPKLQKCTEQNYLVSPIAYSVVGKSGFKRKKR
jgi:hypothetical protein